MTGWPWRDAPKPTLDDLRREIDRIDAAMHELLMERGRIIDTLIQVKKTQDSGSAFRPGREASQMRRAGRTPQGHAAVRHGREHLAHHRRRPSPMCRRPTAVHADISGGDAPMRDTARFHFGFTVPYMPHDSAKAVIDAVAHSAGDLGVFRAEPGRAAGAWWTALAGAGPAQDHRPPALRGAAARTRPARRSIHLQADRRRGRARHRALRAGRRALARGAAAGAGRHGRDAWRAARATMPASTCWSRRPATVALDASWRHGGARRRRVRRPRDRQPRRPLPPRRLSSPSRPHWTRTDDRTAAPTRPVPRPGVLDIEPYVPGKSGAPGGVKVHKLSSNETPLGPSPRGRRGLPRGGATSSSSIRTASATGLREAIGAQVRPRSRPHRLRRRARTRSCQPADQRLCRARATRAIYSASTDSWSTRSPSLAAGGTPVVAPEKDLHGRRRRACWPRHAAHQDRVPGQSQQPDRHLPARSRR